MTSKRNLKRDVEELVDEDDVPQPTLVLNLTSDSEERPELVTESWPDSERHSNESVAVPNYIPKQWWTDGGILTVVSRDSWDKYLMDEPNRDGVVFASDLWDSMTEEQLAREAEYRVENGEPLPELLKQYATE